MIPTSTPGVKRNLVYVSQKYGLNTKMTVEFDPNSQEPTVTKINVHFRYINDTNSMMGVSRMIEDRPHHRLYSRKYIRTVKSTRWEDV